jgi:hypothetical protein
MMRWIIFFLVWSVSVLSAETLLLKRGWNLVGINAPLTLAELKQQLGTANLLVVQGPEQVYKKAYIDQGLGNLNDFEAFESSKGYWVKLGSEQNLTYTVTGSQDPHYTMNLVAGWNLVSTLDAFTLEELISQIGYENLLVVQGEGETYQKAYIDSGNSNANNFERFHSDKGYWIKIREGKTVKFALSHTNVAVDNLGNAVVATMVFEGVTYTLRVFANTEPLQENSSGTLALVGTINGVQSGSRLMLNSTYAVGSSFIVKVFKGDVEVSVSNSVAYSTSPIDFGSIVFHTSGDGSGDKEDNTTFEGIRLFATPMDTTEYGLVSLTQEEFNNLSQENQRVVANKLMSLLFYGVPKTELDRLLEAGTFLTTIRQQLNTPNSDRFSVEDVIEQKSYSWSASDRHKEMILSRLLNLQLGKHYFTRWSAYVLAQTILFSPANELETVGASDILNVYNRLVMLMDDSYSMHMITYLHTISNDNWKRFRSPEDNGREMLEIYLLDFNDSHVPKAGITLKNWRLDRSENELIVGLNQNDVPQELFGTMVTTGFEFYQGLVKSPDFVRGVVTRLVDFYFSESTSAKKEEVVTKIVLSQPQRFEDIFLQILFSKEFLLHTTRVKGVEEATFSIAKRISFFEASSFARTMRDNMNTMHQGSQSYKLGRSGVVPTDTLSFAAYYSFMRRYIMGDVKGSLFNEWDGGWQQAFIDKSIPNTQSVEGLISYLFLTIVSREPSTEEMRLLREYVVSGARSDYSNMEDYSARQGVTEIVMEYLSRLSEVYRFKIVEE